MMLGPCRELEGDGPLGLRLWLIDLREACAAQDTTLLASDELARMRRFRFEADRERYLRAHVGLRRLLAHELGVAPGELAFTPGPHGKPRLAAPHDILDFNLSHCAHFAVLGYSRIVDVGVDIESDLKWTDDDVLTTARGTLTPSELSALLALPAESRGNAFRCAWTRKEACVKALGVGLLIEPSSFEVGLTPSASRVLLPVGAGRIIALHVGTLATSEAISAVVSVAHAPREAVHAMWRESVATRD